MLSLLRSRRWIAFTAAAVIAIIAFGMLSLWQWHRAEQKRLEFAAVSAAMDAPAASVDTLTDPADWRHVTAAGRFDPSGQLLVRNRPQNGSNGFWVVTLLRPDAANGGDVWVVRGFLPVSGTASSVVAAPAPPTGEVTVTGYARTPEPEPARAADDLPEGQVTAMNVKDLDRLARASTVDWFVISSPQAGLAAIPLPEPSDSRNLSYAGQWLLFAAITIGGWFYFLRRESREPAPSDDLDREHPVEVKG